MKKIGPAFHCFNMSPYWARFTAGIQGTHRHKSNLNIGPRLSVLVLFDSKNTNLESSDLCPPVERRSLVFRHKQILDVYRINQR